MAYSISHRPWSTPTDETLLLSSTEGLMGKSMLGYEDWSSQSDTKSNVY